ncbi:MAG TPA: TolC family protein [Puia sp.]|nr:TolC family protein [Puia sp.]
MQRIKIVILFFAACSWHNENFSQENAIIGSTLSVKQCVDIAIKNNLLVEQSDISKQISGVNFNQSKDYLLPFIGANGQQGISFGRSLNTYTYSYVNQQINSGNYGISTSLVLFSGLQTQNAIRQYAYAFNASKLDLEQQKQNITLSVLLAYLQVLSSQDLLDMSRRQADVDAKQVERLDLQNKEGALLLLSNLTDLKGQYASDMVSIATAVNTLETAKINLFGLLNIPYKKEIQYEPIPLDLQAADYLSSSDSIYNIALGTLPGIKSTDLRIKSLQKGLQVARGQYYPTLSFNAGVNTSYSNAATVSVPGSVTNVTTSDFVTVGGTNYNVISPQQSFSTKNISFGDQFNNNQYTSLNLSLSVPILNYLRARNNVKLAKINLQNARYNANSIRLVLQQNVEQAYQNMILANSQYKSYQDEVTAFAESFRTTQIRFNEGVVTSDVYLLAKNKIDAANINLTVSKYNYIFRGKILDFYQGKLTW